MKLGMWRVVGVYLSLRQLRIYEIKNIKESLKIGFGGGIGLHTSSRKRVKIINNIIINNIFTNILTDR